MKLIWTTMKYVDEPKFSIEKVEHEILKVKIKPNVYLEVQDVNALGHYFNKYIKNKKVPFLVILGDYAVLTEGARKVISSPNRLKFKLMEAVVTSSLSQKILINSIIQKQRDRLQMDMFNSEKEAIKWIVSQLTTIRKKDGSDSYSASLGS